MLSKTLPKAVFSESPSPKMSDKYVHIQTSNILEQFADYGWEVASSNSPRYSKMPEFARHAIRMRHRDFMIAGLDTVIPELVILNSHNGTWALRIMLGMFRMVCSNGMVAGKLWDGVTLRHYQMKDLEEKIRSVTGSMNDLSGRVMNCVQEWGKVEMPLDQQLDFATKAAEIRWAERPPVEPSLLLEARRDSDKGGDLWKVFNRVQENLTQGGYSGTNSRGSRISVKAIKNVKRDYKYNAQLFELASEFSKEPS